MPVSFNYYSPRAQKARFGRKMLRSSSQMMLNVTAFISVSAGLVVLLMSGLVALALFIPAVVILLLQLWLHSDDIESSPAQFDPDSEDLVLEKILDRRLLGQMPHSMNSPRDLWQAVRGTWRQQFFSVRYGLGTEVFDTMLSDDPQMLEEVWRRARDLASEHGHESITGAAVTVALFTTIEGYEEFLAQLHLEPVDLRAGVDWQHHIEKVVERFKKRQNFGGIGRDWSAGYTPILNQLGHNISFEIQHGGLLSRETMKHQQVIKQMTAVLSQGGRQNVALVGDVGAGKTTSVYSFAQKLLLENVPSNIRYHQVVTINAPSLLARVSDRVSIESVIIQMITEARAAKNIILFFDEAHLFFNQGTGAVDLSNILMPVLEGGSVRLIMAMTPNDWQHISARNPALAGLINYQAVKESDEQTTLRIMEDQVLLIEHKHNVIFMHQALQEAYRLADRYVHDMVFPGRAIRVMEAAVTNIDEGRLVTEQSVQMSLEATLGVKVQTANREEKKTLLKLEDEIHQRMINQDRAVNVVSNALRRARSGVNSPDRPIGTFLFLGPTGVGKTELSKALSEVYFGGEGNIIRVDMNEYVQSTDVARLLSPATDNATGLLSEIRKQPFSVVLFDEIEKAHPDVINVFLQLLDEGVMRDAKNKQVSFRDAIIIATSNAGADQIRAEIDAGRQLEDFEAQFVNNLIDSNQFKPEFLNRFDEIVLFRPLTKDELLRVVDLMIAGVNKALSRQKVQISVTEAAKDWLVAHGYDPRLGARPLRRTIQRSVENIVAKRLLDESFRPGSTLQLDVSDLEASV